jgi:choline kinase
VKRALIITSAGRSLRFSQSVGKDILKVLYHEGNAMECLLAEQLALVSIAKFELIVIVGGYAFEELSNFIVGYHGNNPHIKMVYNDKFLEYDTCYSFACGLNTLQGFDIDEIVFMEGDLIFDSASFDAIVKAEGDVVTYNREPIRADTSVVFYTTVDGHIHYIYDKNHHALRVDNPFTTIGNSGQVWKFSDVALLHKTMTSLGSGLYNGTNLLPIERYFNARNINQVKFITFDVWFNCNTIDDYRAIRSYKGK